MFADAIVAYLQSAGGNHDVRPAYGDLQCVAALDREQFDVVVLTRAALERCRAMREKGRTPPANGRKIIVLTPTVSALIMSSAIRAGIDAVLDVNLPATELVAQIAEVATGKLRLLDNEMQRENGPHFLPLDYPSTIEYHDALDIEIVRHLAMGMCNKEISTHVHLSTQTVRNRISRVLQDSHIANRTQLASVFVQNELRHLLSY